METKTRPANDNDNYTWLDEMIDKGIEQGRKEGREEGREEGEQIGLQKSCGLVLGSIIDTLKSRFKRVSQRLLKALHQIDDLLTLANLLVAARTSTSLGEFENQLPLQTAKPG